MTETPQNHRGFTPTPGRQSVVWGFTLTEMMVVSVLLLIVGGGLLTTFLTSQASYVSADAYIQVQQEARKALDAVVREVREACPAAPCEVTPAGPAKQLNFQIARGYNTEAGCSNKICWGSENATGDWVHYVISPPTGNNSQLFRYRNTSATSTGAPPSPCTPPACRVLANNVNAAASSFSWDTANKIVTLTFEIRYQNPRLPGGDQHTGTLISRAKLRNPSS